MPKGPVQDVIDAWKAKDYPKLAAGLAVGFAAGFVIVIVLRVISVIVPLVAIFVFDWNPLLWILIGLVGFVDPTIYIDMAELITWPFRRPAEATPDEATNPVRSGARRFSKVAAVAGLVAVAYLIAR